MVDVKQKLIVGVIAAMAFIASMVNAQEVIVHDPVMVKEGNQYYLFSTGPGIVFYQSDDLVNWKPQGSVFDPVPKWTKETVPEFDGHMWAPDIYFHQGRYYLYYSISAFGKNTSAIGVASTPTLDKNNANYAWQDHGMIVQSVPNRDLWNAIDPAIIQDENGDTWMSFGSFWSGIKMARLADNLVELSQPQQWAATAKRERSIFTPSTDAYPGAIEAPFIYKKGEYFYQFVSWDFCCRGAESTYKVVVGRSKSAIGPYLDQAGVDMAKGGGTIVIQGDKNWYGLGHNSAYTFDGKDYIVFHAYDANDNGAPKLKIIEMQWDANGWPVVPAHEIVEFKSKIVE
ncbi:arabinan endo-1,5-alpha-L-arabinosidase [Catenovulum sediminis]|uniref:Extracellular exo-alpha-(1->5)-L-arabinofuranosidase n=1 Tax=Catenovulum sediminis TaxID=1740262 RepID=A0ABV1RCI2_9ALTE|nr:arabinan endo-1,5-alpha-L-arabinosidase [Catenovulum sediminis]